MSDVSKPMTAPVADEVERAVAVMREMKKQTLLLCEATEEYVASDSDYNRGRLSEAKGIRRALADTFDTLIGDFENSIGETDGVAAEELGSVVGKVSSPVVSTALTAALAAPQGAGDDDVHVGLLDDLDHAAKLEQERNILALGAAISRRDWHSVEQAHAALRDAALSALGPMDSAKDGYVLVPREPTEAMIEAGVSAEWGGTLGSRVCNSYRAMLSAVEPPR